MTGTILERVREMTRQALEREAERLFAIAAVKSQISDAAAEGFSQITISPEKPIDLSQTATANATIGALRAEGFSVEWDKRQHPDGRTSQSLMVHW